MVARPEYFAWSAEAQLRYRVKLPDGDREAIVAALLRAHGERQPAALAKLESHGRVPLGACFLDDHQREHLDPKERNLLIVFSGPDALAAVRVTSFLRDCRRIERPLAELRALEVREAKRMRDFVAAQHEDLVKNFDPKVVPLRKKLGVMLHPEALRDMEDERLL